MFLLILFVKRLQERSRVKNIFISSIDSLKNSYFPRYSDGLNPSIFKAALGADNLLMSRNQKNMVCTP